ncbi:hypothetical protein EOD41_02750 [Mucilaginibacter limnophilus]|uniref:Zinc finger CHC2-type domain-containing protein n=1 Tax=Mucilaginibacter limnophilus TaxID=1932778 RepID=A0A3S2Y5Y5_9SPHI|nr:CHC2 zinc finger domain-containing protein [Mucilaginibacter limnophilus]RVU02873.1 hypothetical protein EOD41_02750 [Mucilaginibacter limnophilus]
MLSEELIARIQNETDLAALIQNYIPLQEGRKALKGNCPLHDDNLSFMVMPAKNVFKCFGCGTEGGPIEFLSLITKKTKDEAAEILAQHAGISAKRSA